jgi:hypothetical protein
VSAETEHLWRAIERVLDSPQEDLGPALDAGAGYLHEGSGTSEGLEVPLAHIK